jgi:nucleoside 2-deoxyribosyltransferase
MPTMAANATVPTAYWCSHRDRDVRVGEVPGKPAPLVELDPQAQATVYLAAPFFNLSQRWLVELVRDSVLHLGALVFSPFHDVGVGAEEVARRDLTGLDLSTSLLALLDGVDAGTMFEAGYATHRNLPVIGYAESADPEGSKMLQGTGAELHQDLSTAVYRAVWAGMGMPLAK